ncbi:hypothetical protein Poli38472_002738 [Pythium oligandrum]|uniref:Uncharacterized protein n=1 Tax=Pythium oligandrum TaxID=41045 RepID=A0A8K1FLF9_PYTOL|nr:hypothetical protein Poli38472_002738 [Pythium oligandrum]|eukprot:TMW63797.1 hypothetical protein Poli38472_002738 [Pythium oligandrum]
MYVMGRTLPKGLYEMLTEHEEYAALEVKLRMVLNHALEHWSQKTWTTRMHKTIKVLSGSNWSHTTEQAAAPSQLQRTQLLVIALDQAERIHEDMIQRFLMAFRAINRQLRPMYPDPKLQVALVGLLITRNPRVMPWDYCMNTPFILTQTLDMRYNTAHRE